MLTRTRSQPANDSAITAAAICGSVICQTICGMGRHSQNSRISTKLANSTYVLRSIETGTNRVHQRLNGLRAITLC